MFFLRVRLNACVVCLCSGSAAEAGMEVDRASVQQLAIGYKREPVDPFNFILSMHFVKVGVCMCPLLLFYRALKALLGRLTNEKA